MESNKNDSFYRIFEYGHMMFDAIDKGMVFEQIVITRNITTASGKTLKKGDEYEAVWFLFEKQLFQFIDWIPECNGSHFWIPDSTTLIEIPQAELAPLLVWFDDEFQLAQDAIKRRIFPF